MPTKSTVSGALLDATLAPIVGGKIVATFTGSDVFDGGTRIVTQKVEATTGAQGKWSVDLIVNGEGEQAASSWVIEGYNQYVQSVFKTAPLFLATSDPTTLSDLERMSAANLKAAREAGAGRIVVVSALSEYEALPAGQKRPTDIIIVRGV